MSLKRVAALMVCVGTFVASAVAQRNEISATFGKIFVSSQQVKNANFFDPNIHFGNGMTIGGNYSRVLRQYGIFGISGEVSGAYTPDMDLNLSQNLIPEGYKAYFITPAVRVNFFSGETVTPWVSVGGGYGGLRRSHQLAVFGVTPGENSTNNR